MFFCWPLAGDDMQQLFSRVSWVGRLDSRGVSSSRCLNLVKTLLRNYMYIYIYIHTAQSSVNLYTLPETNIAPENGWLEY